jgi:hypothetical protein
MLCMIVVYAGATFDNNSNRHYTMEVSLLVCRLLPKSTPIVMVRF